MTRSPRNCDQPTNGAGADPARRLAEMRALSRRVAELPERDARSADEIVGYDENGLPN
jgi:hypothetical protein